MTPEERLEFLKNEYQALLDTVIGAVEYSGMPRGTGIGDRTASVAIRLAELRQEIDRLELEISKFVD